MKLHIRDGLWVVLVVGMGLAWWNSSNRFTREISQLHGELGSAERQLRANEAYYERANREADLLSEEVRRLRGLVRSSLADQRQWFELEVESNKLIAIRPGTSESQELTLDAVERIEARTGLEAQRLRHFLTPISELELGRK